MSLRKGNVLISGVGIDGFSPSASVTKSEGITTLTVTDKNGTTTSQILDGGATQIYELSGVEEYDSTEVYAEDDYVYYDSLLYKCNTEGTTGTWDSTKWDEKTYMEYMSDILIGSALGGSY